MNMVKKILKSTELVIGFIVLPGLVLLLNWFLIKSWLWGEAPSDYGSIEVSYISMSRFLVSFFPNLSWAPFWYFGFPFHVFYTPLLPFLGAILHVFKGFSYWQSYRLLTGFAYVLVPVSVYFLGCFLGKKKISGIISAILYSLAPSIFYYVLPTEEVVKDRLTDFMEPRRFVLLQRYGEGPHTLALVFLPLAALFFSYAIKKRTLFSMLLAAVFIGLTALTNAVALYALAMFIFALFFAAIAVNKKQSGSIFKAAVIIGMLSFGLIAFWYNLSFIGTFFHEGGGAGRNILGLFPWGFVLGALILLTVYFIFQKLLKHEGIAASLLWFLILFLIVYIYYTSAPPQLSDQRIEYAPQALRYITEVDMALSLLIGIVLGALFSKFLNYKNIVIKAAELVLSTILVVILILFIQPFLSTNKNLDVTFAEGFNKYSLSNLSQKFNAASLPSQIPLEKTGQYEIANYLKEIVNTKAGERVLTAGNYSFYLNYFTDIWQLRGGLYQASTHFWTEHIYYFMRFNKDAQVSSAWLKISNIKYAVVNLSGTRNFPAGEYNAEALDKFKSFEKVYEKSGDIIYKIPLLNDSPVKIVSIKDMQSLAKPKKADDTKPILAYLSWMEREKASKDATFEMLDNDHYKISANVEDGQGILIQMTSDSGWSAKTSSGNSLRIAKDPMDFFVIQPPGKGNYEITLTHKSSWKQWIGWFVTFATIVFIVLVKILKLAFFSNKSQQPKEIEEETNDDEQY